MIRTFSILLLLNSFLGFNQTIIKASAGGEFVLHYKYEGKQANKLEINIYSTRYACLFKSITLQNKPQFFINDLEISDDGNLLIVKTKTNQQVYNVRDEQLLKQVPLDQIVSLSHQSKYFLVSEEKKLEKYNSHGQKIGEHKLGTTKGLHSVQILNGDENFILKAIRKQHYFYSKSKNTAHRRTFADQTSIDKKHKRLICINRLGKHLSISSFSLPSVQKIYSINSSKFLKAYNKRFTNSDDILTIDHYNNTFSTDSRYLTITAKNREQEYFILLFDLIEKNIIGQIDLGTKDRDQLDFKWISNELLAIKASKHTYRLIHAPTGRNTNHLDVQMNFSDDQLEISSGKQAKKRILSDNLRYVALKHKSNLILAATALKQAPSILKDVQLIDFVAQSKLILLKRKDKLGFIFSEAIEYGMGGSSLPIQWFSDSCVFDSEKVLGEAESPLAYSYPRFERIKHISERHDTTDIEIILQTTSFNDDDTEIEFQLLDKTGVYYTGASAENYTHLWCNLVLQKLGRQAEQVNNFSITEISDDNPKKIAISVVLDYSGSMGSDRIFALETGLKKFFDNKLPEDAVSIIKYDDEVETQGELSQDKEIIRSNLETKAYEKFGGSTALLSGIDEGILSLQEVKNYDDRVIIVITDGNENASMISKNRLIANAIEQGIKVFTIGFGDFVSEPYLKSIAYNTRGNYYRIYQTNDLNWVYQDIYNKLNNYYKIKFKTPEKQKYKAMLKLCLDNNKGDSLTLQFDNSEIDLSQINMLSDDGFDMPFNEFSLDTIKQNTFKDVPDIVDFSEVKSYKEARLSSQAFIEDKSAELKEFEKMNLPHFEFVFDKTEITNNPQKEITELVSFLKKHGHISLEIVGHTDNVGDHDYNLTLSQNRADMIKSIITKKGINPDRLISIGKGDLEFKTENSSETGRQTNRRVEFNIIE